MKYICLLAISKQLFINCLSFVLISIDVAKAICREKAFFPVTDPQDSPPPREVMVGTQTCKISLAGADEDRRNTAF